MDLAGSVANALERSVLSSVIARGGGLRVVAVERGVAILEVTGSPGAVLPLASRIEALIRAAVPEIIGVRITGPGAEAPGDAAGSLAERARQILDAEINPVIAAHRGHVALAGVEQGWVRIRLEGGCQGCSLAEVTLRQGIEPLLRARLPDMTGLIDVTDHEAGTQPFFSPGEAVTRHVPQRGGGHRGGTRKAGCAQGAAAGARPDLPGGGFPDRRSPAGS